MAYGTNRGQPAAKPPVLLTQEQGHELAQELVRLTVEIDRLRTALWAYEDLTNWSDIGTGLNRWRGEGDGPDVARRALAGEAPDA